MTIDVVNTAHLEKIFLDFPVDLYKDDKNYIRPLNKDIEEVFDKKKNKFFKHGECERWLLKNNEGIYIARLAVFVNKKYAQEQPTGGIGFLSASTIKKLAILF